MLSKEQNDQECDSTEDDSRMQLVQKNRTKVNLSRKIIVEIAAIIKFHFNE